MIALRKDKKRQWFIYTIYLLGVLLAIFYIMFPNTFMQTSVHKMYFPNYYVPGSFHWIERVIFSLIIPILFVIELIHSYAKETDYKERKRIKWLTLAVSLGWTFGSLSTPLAYNIPIDPMYGIFFPILFCIPFTYAVINHDLLDIRIVAKRAFYYGILVAICAGILIFLNFLNEWVEQILPGIPIYVVPTISSIFAVAVGIAVWRKVREGDILKYEFINRTMHQLRTPLTHIKLASENLAESGLDEKQLSSLTHIEEASDKLIELTDLVDQKSKA
jgi:signal transduction histidine kinase